MARGTGAHITDLTNDPDQVSTIVHRTLLVPDSGRRFTESRHDAVARHRVPRSLLARLLDLGLPHRGSGGDLRLDPLDLSNVGLALGLRCPQRLAMRWWAKTLAGADTEAVTSYEVELSAACPTPGHPGPCQLDVDPRVAQAAVPGTFRQLAPGHCTLDVQVRHQTFYFDSTFTPLIESVLPLQFHLLPYPLNIDLGFLKETGLADCSLAVRHLIHLGEGLGLAVRPASGYILAPPYAAAHAWIELQVEDEWLPADPMLLNSFARWGVSDARQWPPHRSPLGLVWRLHDAYFEPVLHNGSLLAPTFTVVGQRTVPLPPSEER